MATDATEVLKGILGLVKVTSNKITKPAARIIHILDYHYVSKQDFASESEGYSQEAIELLYQEFLLEVELVQVEQHALLQCLCKHHGLDTAWGEGLTVEGLKEYLEISEILKKAEKKRDDEAIRLICLQYGVVGKLYRDGRIEVVLPLDDKAHHLAAKTLQPAVLETRQKAMVNNLLARDNKFALCVLGGSHDLTAHVPVGVEYLRVAVPSWKKFSQR